MTDDDATINAVKKALSGPPPDPDHMNQARGARGEAALSTYMQLTACDWSTVLSDLLTDLKHWSDYSARSHSHASSDFDVELARAQRNYLSETTNE